MSQTNARLGYPADARLLIINADDFGMCRAVNQAIIAALQEGVVTSTTLMAPCPGAAHAMDFLRAHPHIPFGIHLTVVSDWAGHPWGPIAPREAVPSLIDHAGRFYNFAQVHRRLAQLEPAELEIEFRTQIALVLDAGLMPTHLDWHSLRLPGGDPISELMFRLAREYGLAFRVRGQSWIQEVQRRGLPCNDFDFLDSSLLDPATKAAHYTDLLRNLPAGLSEWAVHPGLNTPEYRALDPDGGSIRQTDLDFFLSDQAKGVIDAQGITLLDYRALQIAWQDKA